MKVSEYLEVPESPLKHWAREALTSWKDYEIIAEPYEDLGFYGATTAKCVPCASGVCVVINKHDNTQSNPWIPSDSIFLTEEQFARIAELIGYRKE